MGTENRCLFFQTRPFKPVWLFQAQVKRQVSNGGGGKGGRQKQRISYFYTIKTKAESKWWFLNMFVRNIPGHIWALRRFRRIRTAADINNRNVLNSLVQSSMIQIDGQSKQLLLLLRLDPTTRAQSLQVEVLDLCTYKRISRHVFLSIMYKD